MVGVKYISYLIPTMSDNKILINLCFDWHSGIMFVYEYKHERLD